MPDRWDSVGPYVNDFRYRQTGNAQYKQKFDEIYKQVEMACWEDGYIDDRLPKGLSMNLQYDLSTVAVLAMLEEKTGVDYSVKYRLNALIQALAPDGDINYLGRGCNQIFTWGPWLYLLKKYNQNKYYSLSLDYLSRHLEAAAANNNLLLNEFDGREKYLWWDYHYSSVYYAHLYMWLVLAQQVKIEQCDQMEQLQRYGNDSGIQVQRTERSFACIFKGRKEYLAERGPVLVAVWTKRHGMIYKGTFGPWQGAFGNNYACGFSVIYNFCGVLKIEENSRIGENRLLNKLGIHLNAEASIQCVPSFAPVEVKEQHETLIITYRLSAPVEGIFNFPVDNPAIVPNTDINVRIDDIPVKLYWVGSIRNQYGDSILFQTQTAKGKRWELTIRL